jgi:hypothetical protein
LIMNYGSVQLSIFFVFVFNTEKKFWPRYWKTHINPLHMDHSDFVVMH